MVDIGVCSCGICGGLRTSTWQFLVVEIEDTDALASMTQGVMS